MKSLRPEIRVARGATYTFFEGVASIVIGVVYFMVLAHSIRPEEMGAYAILSFILTLVMVFGTLALPLAATKYIAQYVGQGEREKAKSVVTRVLQFCLLTSVTMSTMLLLSVRWLSKSILGTSISVFLVFAFIPPFQILYRETTGFLLGLQRIRDIAALVVAGNLIEILVVTYFLHVGFGLLSVVSAWLIERIFASLVGLILTAKSLGFRAKPHPARPLLNFSYPVYISNILEFARGWVDQLFILPFMGQYYLGIYSVAVQAIMVPSLISTSIVTALFPQLSELHSRYGMEGLKEAFHISTRYVVLLIFPVIVGLLALARPVIVLIAGERYVEAAVPLIILSLGMLLEALAVAIPSMLMTLEHTKTLLKLVVAGTICETAMCYVTIAYLNLGMLGAAWARVFAFSIGAGLSIYALRRIFKVTFDKEVLWKALAASTVMAIAIVLLRMPFFQLYLLPLYVTFPLYVIAGAAVYFSSLIALKAIKKHDVELIHDYLPRRLKWLANWIDRVAFIK